MLATVIAGGTAGVSAAVVARPSSPVTGGLPPVVANLSYASASPFETLDVYPAAVPSAPLVILVHGGGWKSKLNTYLPTEARSLQAAGFAVFDLNYRSYSSTGAFPMEIDDVVAGTQWAMSNATTYDANPAGVVMIGGSAGGQLVAMAAEQLDAASAGTVRGVISLSGVFDFGRLVADAQAGSISGYLTKAASDALACPIAKCTAATEQLWSPVDHLPAVCPGSSLLFNSQRELMPLDQPAAMASALQAGGCQVTESIVKGPDHSFAYWHSVLPAILSFISAG